MAKTYKVSTVEVSAQSRKEWLARKRGKGEVATSAVAVVVQSEASSAPSALDALFRQVNIGSDDAPKYVAEALFPLRIGDALLDWHADQKYLGVEHATESEKANFFATGGVTAGGIGSSSGGSGEGGSSTLAGLNDVSLKSAIANDMLVYNGTHWVNTPMSAIKPDLTAYATKSWVEGKGYITAAALAPYALKTELPSLAGYATEDFVTKQGYITASDLDPYATTAAVAETYATKTALQGVDIRVQAIEYIFEKDNDGVINKWSEIVDFLAGVEGTTLDGILDQFLQKAGGAMTGDLELKRTSGANRTPAIKFTDNYWTGYLYQSKGELFWGHNNDAANDNKIIDWSNIGNYALKLSGGTLAGDLAISNAISRKLNLNNPDTSITANNNIISFRSGGTEYAFINSHSTGVMSLTTGGNSFRLDGTGATLNVGTLTAPTFKGNLTGSADSAKVLIPIQNQNEDEPLPNALLQGLRLKFKRYDKVGFGTDANGYWWTAVDVNAVGGGGTSTGKRLQLMYTNSDGNPTATDKLYARFGRDEEWRSPRELAFTDSNVASATKLQTARTIWGQSFDGTGNVDGALSGVSSINGAVLINSSGNVSIGSGDHASTNCKLYVNGALYANGNVIPPQNKTHNLGTALNRWLGVYAESLRVSNGTNTATLTMDSASLSIDKELKLLAGGSSDISRGIAAAFKTKIAQISTHITRNIVMGYIEGNGGNWWASNSGIRFCKYNAYESVGDDSKLVSLMEILPNGNVGIDTSSPTEKLHVNGNVRIGDAILSWDSTNKCVTIKNANTGEKASLFVDGGVTATAIN